MFTINKSAVAVALLLIFLVSGCSQSPVETSVIKTYPLDSLEGVISRSGLRMDKTISTDGNGSLRINVNTPTTINLFETGDIDIENAQLLYRATLRTEGVQGQSHIEMWCVFAGKGEFFSRAHRTPLTGNNDWTVQETPFFLKEGENPTNVKLNLVITGAGTVWVDDIRLLKAPLP